MQILMLLERDYPPDLRVEKEIESLIADGHEITLACFTHRKKLEVEVSKHCRIYRFPISPLTFKSSVAALKFPFYFNFWRKNLEHMFKTESFDAVHIHDLPLAQIGIELRDKYNIPFILDLHENWPALLKISEHTNTMLGKLLSSNKQWVKYEQQSIQNADKVIVVAQEAKERLMKLNLPEEKLVIVSNTVDEDEINFPGEFSTNTRFTLIYAGGLNKHRGLQVALRAVKIAVANIPDINFLIIGEGRYKKTLMQKVHDLNLENNVVFTGWISFGEMLEYLSGSHVALIPHLRNEHTDSTIPHKLFQYFLAGKPVISSDCQPLKRILLQTNSGLIYTHDNPSELADAILRLQDDADLYNEIQRNQKKTLKAHKWSEDADRLVALYQDLEK